MRMDGIDTSNGENGATRKRAAPLGLLLGHNGEDRVADREHHWNLDWGNSEIDPPVHGRDGIVTLSK
jgi:hypothetical protein